MSHGGSKMLARLKQRRAKKMIKRVGTEGPFGTTFVTKKPKTTA